MAQSRVGGPSRKPISKPKKPHKDFPLFPHATKRWAKKVRGKLYYFGSWKDGPQAALEKWLEQKDDLLAGRKPRPRIGGNGLSIEDACNHYLDHIEEQVKKKKLTLHWYQDVRLTCRLIKETIGGHWSIESLSSEDFKQLGDRFALKGKGGKGGAASPFTLKGHIHRTRGLFNWLVKAQLIESSPKYGVSFDAPGTNETTWQSTLSFESGVVSLQHSNDGSVFNDVVPDGANPAWTGMLPWTGNFDIRDASETLTGDTITITIEEIP